MKKRTKKTPITTRVDLRIVSFDLDDLIKTHYGLANLSVVGEEGWQSGTKHQYVITKDDYSDEGKQNIAVWLNGGAWPGIRTVMIAMANDGFALDGCSYYITIVVQYDAVVTQHDDGSFTFPKGLYDLWHNEWPQQAYIVVGEEWMIGLSQSPGWTKQWNYRRSKRQ